MSDLSVRVALHLPVCLRLIDGEYSIRWKGRVYLCRLRKIWADFASGINPDKCTEEIESKFLFKATTGEIAEASNIELEFDKKGFFRHTVFQTTVFLEKNTKSEDVPKQVIDVLLPLINRLLKVYRHATGEFHVTEILWHDLCMVRDGRIMPFMVMDYPLQGQERRRIMGFFPPEDSPLVTVKSNLDKKQHHSIQKILLEENIQIPFERELVLNARDFLNQGRCGLAIFELGTALEIAIDNTLLRKGLSERELRELHFKEKYTSSLSSARERTNGNLLLAVLKIWNIRNNVAHRRLAAFTDTRGNIIGRIESKEDAQPLLESTEKVLNILGSQH